MIAEPSLPCAPVLAAVSLDGPVGGLGGLAPFALPVDSPVGRSSFASRGTPPGAIGEELAGVGDFVRGNPGGGGGGGGGGTPGDGTPGNPGDGNPPATTPDIPSSSNAPEPTTWALMIGGFGMLGGAMRYSRVTRAA